MLMAIMERTREIGTQLAVGTSRIRLLVNFLYEGLMIGVFGGLLGLLVGAGLAELIDHAGLRMPPPPGGTSGYPLYVDLVPSVFIGVFILIVTTTVVSTIAPAFKASRMKIVDALGHV
jgi:putative ABC transport system permease protein